MERLGSRFYKRKRPWRFTESFAIRTLEVTGCASGFLTRTWLTRVPTTWMMDQRSLRKMESWFWRFLLPAQMGHAWIQAWRHNIHVFNTNCFMQWECSAALSWSSLPEAIGYPSTGTLVRGGLFATSYLSILGTPECRISSLRCIVFCRISVPSENLSGRVMSRDAFTYGCLTQHSLPLELLQWIWQDWNPAPLLCAGIHPIALSAAVLLMKRLIFMCLVTLDCLVRRFLPFQRKCQNAIRFGLLCNLAKHQSFGCF